MHALLNSVLWDIVAEVTFDVSYLSVLAPIYNLTDTVKFPPLTSLGRKKKTNKKR